MSTLENVFAALERRFGRTLEDLMALARIPSVSAAEFDPKQVERSAEHCAGLLEAAGLERVERLSIAGSHPYVVGEWLHAGEQAPTVLIYAHHDVQPPGRIDRWQTPAWEPTVRDDGRMYGRGVVDDKAGLLLHLAALHAWFEATGSLPVNVKLLVEGEEEIGSPNLEAFLRQHVERLRADVIVLSDTANLATGVPSLTTSLRGLLTLNLRVQALDHPVHSGMWGGPVMDAAAALVLLLARVVDERGNPRILGFDADVPVLSAADRARLAALPFDTAAFRSDAGMLPHVEFTGDPKSSVYERLWFRPALAVTAFESVPMARATNQLIDEARAQLGVRLAPGQDPERVRDLLVAELRRDPPWGVRVDVDVEGAVPGWRTVPEGPAFEAAERALRTGFGRDPVHIGCGGTIPFVGPFSAVLSGAPALLLGLEDPVCNAHGENESLHLEDFRKATRGAACLLAELAAAL
jgi:cysteinylglycine-S-conjugate dipeptidase